MKTANKLKKLINTKKAKICIVGLGYVGLPIAVEFAKKDFTVYGFDAKREKTDTLKRGISHIDDISNKDIKAVLKKKFSPTHKAAILGESDVIVICVPTPLRKRRVPNISYIIKAARDITKYLRKGQLVILESTTYPGTARDVILPVFRKSGLRESKDFFLSFSPERIDPGNKRYPFRKIPKIVGGLSSIDGELTQLLYSKIIDQVHRVSTTETAEVVKLLENSFRIVNIGMINEFAMLCNKLNIDVWEVVEAARTKPFGFMPFYPGPGIGGHCIPCDPLYLSWKARKVGFRTKMIDLASKTNLFMPHYVVHRIEKLLKERKKALKHTKVLILGVTYKKNIKDLRESPALDIIDLLGKKDFKVTYSDPYIPYLKIDGISLKGERLNLRSVQKTDVVVLVTDHDRFNYDLISRNAKIVLDTRNAFGRKGIARKNIIKL